MSITWLDIEPSSVQMIEKLAKRGFPIRSIVGVMRHVEASVVEAIARRSAQMAARERVLDAQVAQLKRRAHADAKAAERRKMTTGANIVNLYRIITPSIGFDKIVEDVCRKTGVSKASVYSRLRMKPIILARHEIMYRAFVDLHISQAEIGRRLGMDHSTVIYGIAMHAERNGFARPRALDQKRAAECQ